LGNENGQSQQDNIQNSLAKGFFGFMNKIVKQVGDLTADSEQPCLEEKLPYLADCNNKGEVNSSRPIVNKNFEPQYKTNTNEHINTQPLSFVQEYKPPSEINLVGKYPAMNTNAPPMPIRKPPAHSTNIPKGGPPHRKTIQGQHHHQKFDKMVMHSKE